MQSGSHIKLVWSTSAFADTGLDVVATKLKSVRGYRQLVSELGELRKMDLWATRRLIAKFLRQLRKQPRLLSPRAAEQLPLPLSASSPPPTKANVVPFSFIEEHNGPCPSCRRPVVEISRHGSRSHYTCLTRHCEKKGALFIMLVATGDD